MIGKYAFLAVIALTPLLLARPAGAEPRSFRLDHEHMNIAFLAQHLSFARVLGVFHDAEATLVFDEDIPALDSLDVRVSTASVDTRHEARDNHLRSGDFFDSRNYPEMIFTMTGAEQTGERSGIVTGDLTLIGQTRPMSLDVEWKESGNYPFGDRHYAIGISARGTILRSAWGMNYGVADGFVGDEIEIIIEAEFIRED
nr:MAG: polyisoprenoid-binding protein [Hyphomicrobiales bacterium]